LGKISDDDRAKCWLGVPLMIGDTVLGTITVQSSVTENLYTEHHRDLLIAIASQAAISIQNARLFQQTAQRNQELSTLNEIIGSASQSLALQDILDMVLSKTMATLEFEAGLITMFNEERGKLERIVRKGLPGEIPPDPSEGLEDSLCNVVFRTRQSLIIDDLREGAPVDVKGEIEAGFLGYAGVPLESRGKVLGTLCIFKQTVEPIDESTVNLLQTIGRQVGFAIENARLFEETSKFKLGIERAGDAIFMTDTTGKILYINPAFTSVYGYSATDAMGQTPRILKSGLMGEEDYRSFWKTLLSRNSVTGEIINKTKDGRLVNIAGTNSPILDEKGNILGFLAVHHDITSTKQAEEAIRQSERALQRQNEYLATAARFGVQTGETLETALFQRIMITEEVRQTAGDMRRRGILVFGLSDKPDEASFPSSEQARKGMQPLHRLETACVGEA
jgi:PAS domain S-box-containing protein